MFNANRHDFLYMDKVASAAFSVVGANSALKEPLSSESLASLIRKAFGSDHDRKVLSSNQEPSFPHPNHGNHGSNATAESSQNQRATVATASTWDVLPELHTDKMSQIPALDQFLKIATAHERVYGKEPLQLIHSSSALTSTMISDIEDVDAASRVIINRGRCGSRGESFVLYTPSHIAESPVSAHVPNGSEYSGKVVKSRTISNSAQPSANRHSSARRIQKSRSAFEYHLTETSPLTPLPIGAVTSKEVLPNNNDRYPFLLRPRKVLLADANKLKASFANDVVYQSSNPRHLVESKKLVEQQAGIIMQSTDHIGRFVSADDTQLQSNVGSQSQPGCDVTTSPPKLSLSVLKQLEENEHKRLEEEASNRLATDRCKRSTRKASRQSSRKRRLQHRSDQAQQPIAEAMSVAESPLVRKVEPSDFLLGVKDRVALLRLENSKKKTKSRGSREMGAVERAELMFEKGAILSQSSEDSQGSDVAESCQSAGLRSVKSDQATVAGRINPYRIRDAERRKLQREGYAPELIDFEMACHLQPEEALQAQRQRKRRQNQYMMRKRVIYANQQRMGLQLLRQEQRTVQSKGRMLSFWRCRELEGPLIRDRVVINATGSPTSPTSGLLVTSSAGSMLDSPASPPPPSILYDQNPESPASTRNTPTSPAVRSAPDSLADPLSPRRFGMQLGSVPTPGFFLKSTEGLATLDTTQVLSDFSILGQNQGVAPKYTHDQKLLARKRQKAITKLFAELQKKRDRGELTCREFEEEKQHLFDEVFEEREDGRMGVKVGGTLAGIKETKKRMRSCEGELFRKRGRWATRMPGWKRDDSGDTDAALEEGDVDNMGIDYYADDDEDSDTEIGTWVEIRNTDDYHYIREAKRRMAGLEANNDVAHISIVAPSPSKRQLRRMQREQEEFFIRLMGQLPKREQEKRQKNIERREMLMRCFDQRAPPSERMFKQDTSFRSDGRPTLQQEQDWAFWRTPSAMLPSWMKEDTSDRVIIFPEDRRRLLSS